MNGITRNMLTTGLVGTMVATNLVAPTAALASEAGALPQQQDDHVVRSVKVDVAFSTATQRLVSASNGETQITLETARDLLNQVQAAADAADAADAEQAEVVATTEKEVATAETSVETAQSNVSSELQAQIDALSAQLTDAQAKSDELIAAKDKAQMELDELNDKIDEARTTAEEKQEALDEADAALKAAQEALDALGESPTADEQEAYDKAKDAYDAAVADRDAKEEALIAANETLGSLESQLETQKGSLLTAEDNLVLKKQEVADAESALETAKGNYASAVESITGQIFADAEASVEAAEADLANKESVIPGLQSALDNANAAIPGLESALASAQSDEAAAQGAYDAIAPQWDGVQTEMLNAERARAAAEREYNDACASAADPSTVDRSKLDAAEAALAKVMGRYGSIESQYNAASSALSTAKGATATAQTNLANGQAAVTTAEYNLAAGQQAVSDAESALASAQSVYDDAVATAGEQAEQQAQADIDAKKATLDSAQAALDECERIINETPTVVADLESKIEAENQKLSDAEDDVESANSALTDAESVLDEAEKRLEALADEQAAWDEKAKPLQDAVKDAEGKVEQATLDKQEADKAVTDLEGQIADVQEKIDELKEQSGEVVTQAVDDLADFMAWLHLKTREYNPAGNNYKSDCAAALGFLAYAAGGGWGVSPSNDIEQYTHLGDKDDATYLENVLISLDMIDQLNAIRKAEGVRELSVSLAAMVESAYFANWSAETGTIGHASNNGYEPQWGSGYWGENAAWGYNHEDGKRDFFTGWYYEEKANATGVAQTDPKTGITYQPEADGQTGHYYNIIRSNWNYTGMAYTPSGSYGTTAVNDFASGNNLGGWSTNDSTFTTEELRELIEQAQKEGVQKYEFKDYSIEYIEGETVDNSAQIAELEEKIAALRAQLDAAEKTAGQKAEALSTAESQLDAAEANLAAIGGRPTAESLEQAVSDAEDKVAAAKEELEKQQEDYAVVEKAVNEAIGAYNDQIEDLINAYNESMKDHDALLADRNEAQSALYETEKKYEELFAASDTLDAARDAVDEANAELDAAQKAVDLIESSIAETEEDVEKATADRDAKKEAFEASGPTQQQTEDLAKAEKALKDAQDELDRLTGERDAAKEKADAAKEEKEIADGVIKGIEDGIAANEKVIADADKELPKVQQAIDTWSAVFAQQSAESIVKDGPSVTVDDASVTELLDGAHAAYQQRLQELADAEERLESARAAYLQALSDKKVTEQERADMLVELAVAQHAYDVIKSRLDEDLVDSGKDDDDTQQAVFETNGGSGGDSVTGAAAVGSGRVTGDESATNMYQTSVGVSPILTAVAFAGALFAAAGAGIRKAFGTKEQ